MYIKLLRNLFIVSFIFISSSIFSQNRQLDIVDIGSKQIEFLKKYYESKIDSVALISKIYNPYQEMWRGYVGSESDFINWVNSKSINDIDYWYTTSQVNSKILTKQLRDYAKQMYLFTGEQAVGKWYIFYGPAHTNLGGLSNGEKLIDLAHENNFSNEEIMFVYPHELNHQIYNSYSVASNYPVLYKILDEGFATYINYIFNNRKRSIAKELYYTDEELKICRENDVALVHFLSDYFVSNNTELATNLASRDYKINEKLPGGIAYYLGFRIVEEYVKQNGKDSWKDIYAMEPIDVLLQSNILKLYK